MAHTLVHWFRDGPYVFYSMGKGDFSSQDMENLNEQVEDILDGGMYGGFIACKTLDEETLERFIQFKEAEIKDIEDDDYVEENMYVLVEHTVTADQIKSMLTSTEGDSSKLYDQFEEHDVILPSDTGRVLIKPKVDPIISVIHNLAERRGSKVETIRNALGLTRSDLMTLRVKLLRLVETEQLRILSIDDKNTFYKVSPELSKYL